MLENNLTACVYSADEFDGLKLEDGSFIDSVANDPKGLLSLYNAANLLTHNEGALEEALIFARRHLELIQSSLESPLADQVARALKIPLPRTLKRIEAVSYMQEYSVEQRYNPAILELAKLDFNLLQRLHQKELKTISQ
jgi:(-)-germacrene D synthase